METYHAQTSVKYSKRASKRLESGLQGHSSEHTQKQQPQRPTRCVSLQVVGVLQMLSSQDLSLSFSNRHDRIKATYSNHSTYGTNQSTNQIGLRKRLDVRGQ